MPDRKEIVIDRIQRIILPPSETLLIQSPARISMKFEKKTLKYRECH